MSKASKIKAINALKNHKAEQEEQLHNNIVAALARFKHSATINVTISPLKKITVQDLATEAEVSRGSLYGNHRGLLMQLKKLNEKRTTGVTSTRHKQEEKALSDAEALKQLAADKEALAQENYRLQHELKRLRMSNEALTAQLGNATNVTTINKSQNRKGDA